MINLIGSESSRGCKQVLVQGKGFYLFGILSFMKKLHHFAELYKPEG